jgi:hypothetical protein
LQKVLLVELFEKLMIFYNVPLNNIKR